jgi:hypothetical protein
MAMPNHNSEFSRWADRLVFGSTAARRPPFYVRVRGPNVEAAGCEPTSGSC